MRILIILAFLISSQLAWSDSSTGCGLGSMIWKKNSIVSALFRFTTNHSFSSQLFGITTGTSGCSQHSIVKKEMYPIYYAEANLPELKYEMAVGQGEYLITFAEVLGCAGHKHSDFSLWAKARYSQLFSHENIASHEFLKNLGRQIKNSHLASVCNNTALI